MEDDTVNAAAADASASDDGGGGEIDHAHQQEDIELDLKSPFKSPPTPTRLLHHHHLKYLPPPQRTPGGGSSSCDDSGGEESSGNNRRYSSDGDGDSSGQELEVHGHGHGRHQRVNPFEKDILANLTGSFWSPGVLEVKATPPQRNWAIEHLSHLFPKDIENSPSTHQNAFPVDDQTEAKAQADIDEYFSRGPIVPTPSPILKESQRNILPTFGKVTTEVTVARSHFHLHHSSPIARGLGIAAMSQFNSKIKRLTVERSTQTSFSLPPNLPPEVEAFMQQYCQEENCGASGGGGEEVTYSSLSQRSEVSDIVNIDGGSNDSNSGGGGAGGGHSNHNNSTSIRRRLELSFGDDLDGGDNAMMNPPPPRCPSVDDPFRRNHLVSTPSPSERGSGRGSGDFDCEVEATASLNTTTSELEVQLLRCEFTPDQTTSSRSSFQQNNKEVPSTPGLTPIRDDLDPEQEFGKLGACSSTPRTRFAKDSGGGLERPWSLKNGYQPQPVAGSSAATSTSTPKKAKSAVPRRRRSRAELEAAESHQGQGERKTSSASSFDDSQFLKMDDSSPPTKVQKRLSEDNCDFNYQYDYDDKMDS